MRALEATTGQKPEPFNARRRERRGALGELLIAVTRTLQRNDDVVHIRGAFEAAVRRLAPVRSATLRDLSSRWSGRSDAGRGAESITLEVPGAPPYGSGMLEATFDPSAPLGEWDFQMLGFAAHVAALVLEIDRSRQQLARVGFANAARRAEAAAPLIGSTAVMRELRDTVARVAATDFTVLLEGESGVGKELVARQIHEMSRRRNGPFVAINCAALVETLLEAELFGIEDRVATGVRARRGKFEAADGGTLFLDEVSDLSPSAQAKLLRAIQDMAVERVGSTAGGQRLDIRIIAATNRPLCTLVEQRVFRTDLFYRLSGVDVRVPALRERREDIPELTQYFLNRHRTARSLTLSPEAADALASHHWPGNVRELERLIERTVALGASDRIELEDLSPAVAGRHLTALAPSLQQDDSLRTWARKYVALVLARHNGNRRHAARALGISYHTLRAYLRPVDVEDPCRSDDLSDAPAPDVLVGADGAA